MASQVAFGVYDGAATPVLHSFTENGVEKTSTDEWAAYWKELSATLPEAALNRCVFRMRKQKDGKIRLGVRIDIPVMEAVSGVNASGYTAPPKVALVESAEFVQYVSPRSTETGRRLVRQMVVNLAGSVGISVVPGTVGQAALLIDKIAFPS